MKHRLLIALMVSAAAFGQARRVGGGGGNGTGGTAFQPGLTPTSVVTGTVTLTRTTSVQTIERTLGGNITCCTLSGFVTGDKGTVRIIQDGSVAYSITYNASVVGGINACSDLNSSISMDYYYTGTALQITGVDSSGCTFAMFNTAIPPQKVYSIGTSIPAASGAAGEVFIKSDTKAIYVSDGASFSLAGGSGGGGLTGSAVIDFASMIDGQCIDNTFTLTGLTAGNTLSPGWPSTLTAGFVGNMIASAPDTVKVRLCNQSGGTVDLASLTYSATKPTAIVGSGTIDFSSLLDGACGSSTFTLTGAIAGDRVAPGYPAAFATGLIGRMVATAADTVTVQVCNVSGATLDPASGTFSGAIF